MMLYISGAISAEPRGPDYARRNFAHHANILADNGYAVLNPYDVPACPERTCAGVQAGDIYAHTWDCYLRHDIAAFVTRCAGVAQLPGWELSHGARLEAAIALQLGMPVKAVGAWVAAIEIAPLPEDRPCVYNMGVCIAPYHTGLTTAQHPGAHLPPDAAYDPLSTGAAHANLSAGPDA